MADQARGVDFVGTFFEENEYGTPPEAPADGYKLYARSFNLRGSRNLLQSEILYGGRGRRRPAGGNLNVAGDIVTELAPEWPVPLLKHTLGVLQTTGGGPYTHVLTCGPLPVGGLTFEADHGAAISGAGRFERFWGVRPASMNIEVTSEGYVLTTFGMLGKNHGFFSSALDSDPMDYGHSSFTARHATLVEEGGSPIATVTQWNLAYDNDLDDSVFALGGGGQRRRLPYGFANVGGQMRVLFEDPSLLNKAIDDVATSLKLTFARGNGGGTVGNESIEIFVPFVILEPTSPETPGPRGKSINFNYQGFSGTGLSPLRITVKNMSSLALS